MTETSKLATMLKPPDPSFIATKEYRRFAEFANACKNSRYIGLCHGAPGVGKTKSARHYMNWDFRELYSEVGRTQFIAPPEVRDYDTIFYTPPVVHSARDIMKQVSFLRKWLSILIIDTYSSFEEMMNVELAHDPTKLIIIDECDRLTAQGIEYFRSIFDEDNIAIIFMGMPGLEKRLARYPQLYSRIGFAHEFKTLSLEEMRFIVETRWSELGTPYRPDDYADIEALATLVSITHGNFRLLRRLLMQVDRIMRINGLTVITKEVIQAAREILIIGTE